ncbi:MAG: hypothetical protein LV480_12370 [Methylacidiphilales bacterium]|nr:hypothetical protein [Candidatus Methylacidiphilales bacterium]
MSVAELLHEIEALPSEERLRLVEKLVQLTEADVPESLRQSMAEAERMELEKKLKQRPHLGVELAEAIKRMQAGQSVDLEEAQALHRQLEKLGL